MTIEKQVKLLEKGLEIRVNNCGGICRQHCFKLIKLYPQHGETVKEEVRLPSGEGVADVAILDKHGEPRVILEVLHSHRTSVRREPWVELDATEVIEAKATNGVLTLTERRLALPDERGCKAFTFQDKLDIAGFHESTIRKEFTFAKLLDELWKNGEMNELESMLPYYVREDTPFMNKVRWFVEADDAFKSYHLWAYPGMLPWAQMILKDSTAQTRARRAVLKEQTCIDCRGSCERGPHDYLLCLRCLRKREAKEEPEDDRRPAKRTRRF